MARTSKSRLSSKRVSAKAASDYPVASASRRWQRLRSGQPKAEPQDLVVC
jgi:hypothetical protein